MSVQVLIYIYLAVCVAMILFNCICILVFRRREQRIESVSHDFQNCVQKQLDLLEQGQPVQEAHKRYLRRRLRSVGNLLAFDRMLSEEFQHAPEAVRAYLSALIPVFTYLTLAYRRRDLIKAAFFPYIIQKYQIIRGISMGLIVDTMLDLVKESNVYCRENALQALYSTGDCTCVLQALQILDRCGLPHNSKLLSDGLLRFAGDSEALIRAIWARFERFSVPMQVILLNYIRFASPAQSDRMLALLSDQSQDDEIRFACIRYFARYRCEEALPLLQEMASRGDESRWEYAAISSTALSSYPCEQTVAILKHNLYNKNWYVRFNASESLERLGYTYLDLIDVVESGDRYAREMLQYRFDQQRSREAKAVSV